MIAELSDGNYGIFWEWTVDNEYQFQNEDIESDLTESRQNVDKLTEQLAEVRRELDRARRRARLSDDSLDSSSRNRTQEQLRLDLARLSCDYVRIVLTRTELTD